MANASTVRNGLDTLIAENWSNTLISTIADVMPLVNVIMGKNGTKSDVIKGIGVPDSGMLLSGIKNAQVRKREILSSLIYQPIIHNALPPEADGKVLSMTDNMPMRSDWENNSPAKRFTRPATKWCEIGDPLKVPNEHLRHTKKAAAGERNGWEAVGDLLRVERDDVLIRHMQRWNQLFWGTYSGSVASTSGGPSSESLDKWDAPYSVKQQLATTGICHGVDRDISTGTYFKGNTIASATPAVFRDMIRYANYEMTIQNADGTTSAGLASKNASLDVLFTGGALFSIALAEAEGRKSYQVIPGGQPISDFGQFGFKRDAVRIDNTWVVFDPGCPAGDVLGMNTKTWTFGIHPDANFKQSTPTDQSDIEGGDDAHTWNLRTKIMLICEAPHLNVYWDAVA